MRPPFARLSLIATPVALAMLLAACGASEPAMSGTDAASAAADPAQEPVMPHDAPPQEEVPDEAGLALDPNTPAGETPACRDDIGAQAAGRLVERCLAVSPATRPPCNADNSCEMIEQEIDRSCAMFSEADRPAECAD